MGGKSTKDADAKLTGYPEMKVDADFNIIRIRHEQIWDDTFGRCLGFSEDLLQHKNLGEVIGHQNVKLLRTIVSVGSSRSFSLSLSIPSPSQEPTRVVVYGLVAEKSSCCALNDILLWFLPSYAASAEKRLMRSTSERTAPLQYVCQHCGLYTLDGDDRVSQTEMVERLLNKGYRLLHCVADSSCHSCNIRNRSDDNRHGSVSPNGSVGYTDSPESSSFMVLTPKASVRRSQQRLVLADTDQVPSSGGEPRKKEEEETSGRLVTVLVESDPQIKESFSALLRRCGLVVFAFADVKSATRFLQSHNIGLAVVDVVLAGASGSDVIRSLRRSGSPHVDVPVLAIGGSPMFSELAIASGANAFIGRTASAPEIRRMVYSLMTRAKCR